MALSFEESKKQLSQSAATPMMMSMRASDITVTDTTTTETFTQDTNYTIYSDYKDENISYVDNDKNITVDSTQINLTQEENSQYIPFEMDRKYDGIDLAKMKLQIHFVNSKNHEGFADVINVSYSSSKIRFGWLVDSNVTYAEGELLFEIVARGEIGSGTSKKQYVWKTRPNGKLNILKSLSGNGHIEPNEDWYTQLMAEIDEKVATAQSAAEEARGYMEEAKEVVFDTSGVLESIVDEKLENYYDKDTVDEKVANVKVDLTGYATEDYVDDAVASVDVTQQLKDYAFKSEVPTKVSELENDKGYLTEHQDLSAYALKTELPSTDGLATETYVQEKIAEADISEKLADYAKSADVYTKSEVDDVIANVEVDLSSYYTKTEVDEKDGSLSSAIAINASNITTNTTNISSLSTTVGKLQDDVNAIDKSPRLTYDIVYNDSEDENSGENVFVFYEIENEGKENEVKELKKRFTISGGSGGSASSNTLYIYYDKDEDGNNITKYDFTVENVRNKEAIIYYDFDGIDPVGDSISYANATWKIRKGVSGAWATIKTETIYPGTDLTFNASEYITSIATYSLKLVVSDDTNALVEKTWVVQQIDFKIESTFNDKLTYPIGTVSFDYKPTGAISKDIHFIFDGKEIKTINTTSSGIPMAYELPTQEHGAHLLEVYMTATNNGSYIESNHIVKDILWYDSESTIPVIGSIYQNFTARQYDATNIEYTVYDPTTETPTIEIAVDGHVVSTPTLEKATNIYSFKTDVVGEHIITITCGETVKTLTATITELDIDVTPVTFGLAFDFNPSGKSNNDIDRVWTNGEVSMSVSDNFDWINGGYQYDENGDQYFCIKAGTSATIDYHLFADDAKKNGKEFKLVFKTTNVASPDATFLSCVDNTTGSDHVGIQMDVHEAFIYGQAGSLHLPYSEEDVIEFEFNISKDTEDVPMLMGYEDGVSTRPMVYDDSHNFTQNTPKIISLGSEDCDLHIYRFKVYNTSLSASNILKNFIADARSAEEMIARYERNQIYNEGVLDPDDLAEKCPWLRIIKIEAPYFTNHKDNKVPNTTVEYIYKNGTRPSDNWKATDAVHSGQGTSSNNYGAAGRNLDVIVKKVKDKETGLYINENPIFTLSDGSNTNKVSLTDNSVPVNYFNIKVNIASSNNLTNAMLAKRYNDFNPYNRPFIREDESEIEKIKDTMEFYNCVVFIKESDTDMSTHREFADNEWHFYAIGNIGDSKKTDDTRLTDQEDKYECCVEIMDVKKPLSDFPVDTMMNAMGYKEDETTHEKIYTWAKDENLGILYELIDGKYVLTEDTTIDLNKTYYVDILEHDDFSEDYTYGWRYISDDEDEEVVNYCHQKWIDFYRFVTTSTDEEFKVGIGNYFVLDSALYYYLFTTRYCMVDNRAKNTFWHYGKSNDVDQDGNPIRKWDLSWDYDNDTALGLNNYGKQVYRYGLEDTDRDEKGEEVFREMDSTFFCRIRDLFQNELKAMYKTLESKNAWHAESFINKADEWQSEFPEELWRLDIERKYIRTYNGSFINGKGDSQFLVNMANGKMKYHRRQWERSQEQYMASKYQSFVASGDDNSVVMRCGDPSGNLVVAPNYKLKLTPYSYMYLNVEYSSGIIQIKAVPNVEYEIPFNGDSTDIIKVYSASCIKSLGDLSSCYLATIGTGTATKLKELIIGNATEGYDNPYFTTLTTGANYLLEKLNIENVSGLTQSLNLSTLHNLRELYAHGSNASGITFADGGKIEIAELPAINTLTMKNLIYLTTLDIADFSKLTTLTVENCNTVDLITILDGAEKINRVRITGIDWSLDDDTILERLYNMKGIDKNGYNVDQSILTGVVNVSVIREKQLEKYYEVWPDLQVIPQDIITQCTVTFINKDGTVLDVQYVDKGSEAPVDPTTREDNPISIPTLKDSVTTTYEFKGWNVEKFEPTYVDMTIEAIYNEYPRKYTVRYLSNGRVLQETQAEYGSIVTYKGETPTYTVSEAVSKYSLFSHWDQFGYVDSDKTINAVYDSCDCSIGPSYFQGKELSDLRPVEIYAMIKMGVQQQYVDELDSVSIELGYDIDCTKYENCPIEEDVLITEERVFDGTNYYDTNIQLFDEDKDFVLAVDYSLSSLSKADSVLMQCYSNSNKDGFKLYYNNGVQLSWCTSSNTSPSVANEREIIVIRHKKGESGIHIYSSNITANVNYIELGGIHTVNHTNTLVFGCQKTDGGNYRDNAIGSIYWSKIWYTDLGDDVCRQIVCWPHETISFKMCGFNRYSLSNGNLECAMSFIANNPLCRKLQLDSASVNAGGWAKYSLNTYLNDRLYKAFPTQWRQLLKQVKIWSSNGDKSTTVSSSDCYLAIPSIREMLDSSTTNIIPYSEEGYTISQFTDNKSRVIYDKSGTPVAYFTRSPNVSSTYGVFCIKADGSNSGFNYPYDYMHIRLIFSI